MLVGSAKAAMSSALGQSRCSRKIHTRVGLVISAERLITGTIASGPISGTSTSGISMPVPYPASPPMVCVTSAAAAISARCQSSRPKSDILSGSVAAQSKWTTMPS